MPLYDYRCTTCDTVYEARRSMADADSPARCPQGHTGAVRLLPVFATVGLSQGAGGAADPASGGGYCGAPMAGGCGGGCACHPG